jgi:HEAT repeat protein
MPKGRDPNPLSEPEVEALVKTAFFDPGGESIEGAFVDRWEAYSDQAVDELLSKARDKLHLPGLEGFVLSALESPQLDLSTGIRVLFRLGAAIPEFVEKQRSHPDSRVRAVVSGARLWSDGEALDSFEDPDPLVREHALRTLIHTRSRETRTQTHVRRSLEDPSTEVRQVAAENTWFLGDPEGQSALLRRLDAEPEARVRRAILLRLAREAYREGIHRQGKALRDMIGEGVMQTLIAALGHEDAEIREAAARAMERFREIPIAQAMLQRLCVEQDSSVRFALIRFYGYSQIADEAFPVLEKIFREEEDQAVRVWTGFQFASFGSRAEPVLLEALAGDRSSLYRPAVMSLGAVGTLRAAPVLTRLLASAGNRWFQREIESALIDVVIRAAYDEPPRAWPENAGETVQGLIDALDLQPEMGWPTRVCKNDLNALPLWGRGLDLWALRPDGRLLCLDLDSVRHETWDEDDPEVRFASLVHGAETYPELAELIPTPPKDLRPCKHCLATGTGGEGLGGYCLRCSGLGWAPHGRTES